MIEVKISGRGGQGAVLASQVLATAFFEKGFYVQSFPSFGAERRGAPVSGFLRVDTKEITLRYSVQSPDWMVLFDANLLKNPMVMAGMSGKTSLLVNTKLTQGLEVRECKGLYVVDATSIAEELKLRTTSFSMVNTAMVGAFAKASGLLDLESIEKVIADMAPVKRESNVAAARKAFETVKEVAR
jgi:2-oxoacid:acceptor oxidoreductase gamma subunit (pyruvate/2-ketoisovalerate family)